MFLVSEEDRTIVVKVNDGGLGISSEPTEWNPDGITVETSFVMNPATVENGLYRIPIYIQGIKENGSEFVYPGMSGFDSGISFTGGTSIDPGVAYVTKGSATSAPTIDEPCNSPVGTFCPHTLFLNNRFYPNAWSDEELVPLHPWSDGNGRIKYLSAISPTTDEHIYKVAEVNQLGYIINIQSY